MYITLKFSEIFVIINSVYLRGKGSIQYLVYFLVTSSVRLRLCKAKEERR